MKQRIPVTIMTMLMGITLALPVTAFQTEGGRRVEFRGLIENLPSSGLLGTWVVGGRRVLVTETTRIDQEDGPARVGALVEVHGFLDSATGSINATQIAVKARDGEGEAERVEFRGVIESLPDGGLIGVWLVSGHRVHVSESTRIDQEHGSARVGALVEVHGFRRRDDGGINAVSIEVKSSPDDHARYIEFRGTITSLPASGLLGDWQVDRRTVHVSERTRIDQEHGRAAVGSVVEVKGWVEADGSVLADIIEVRSEPDTGAETSFRGTVERLPVEGLIGDWLVSGRIVHVTDTTRIKNRGRVQAGSVVLVTGLEHSDGSVMATTIKVKG